MAATRMNTGTVDIATETAIRPFRVRVYRWRLGLAQGDSQYDELEQRLAKGPVITVPTITLEGDANGAFQRRRPSPRRFWTSTGCQRSRRP
jgi:hypothetical protein